jgi:hypothetical protein
MEHFIAMNIYLCIHIHISLYSYRHIDKYTYLYAYIYIYREWQCISQKSITEIEQN